MILAGSIGVTSSELSLLSDDLDLITRERIANGKTGPLAPTVRAFVRQYGANVTAAAFAVVDAAAELAARPGGFGHDLIGLGGEVPGGLPPVLVLSQAEAAGYGLASAAGEHALVLQEGRAVASAHRAVITIGDEVGVAALVPTDTGLQPIRTWEADRRLSPDDPVWADLFPYVSRSRSFVRDLLSGPGLVDTYLFLRCLGPFHEPCRITEAFRHEDPTLVIAREAVPGGAPLCNAAVDLQLTMLGRFAARVARNLDARGGLFITGPLAAELAARLGDEVFLTAFLGTDPSSDDLLDIPVQVVADATIGLRGAARAAMAQLWQPVPVAGSLTAPDEGVTAPGPPRSC